MHDDGSQDILFFLFLGSRTTQQKLITQGADVGQAVAKSFLTT